MKKAFVFICCFFMTYALVETNAQAQTHELAAKQLVEFLHGPTFTARVDRLFSELPPAVFVACPALLKKQLKPTLVQADPVIAPGDPNALLLRQSYSVSGCGNDTQLNFYFLGNGTSPIRAIIALPGGSHASLGLEKDAVRYALIGAALRRDCKDKFEITNTQFDHFGTDNPHTADPGAGVPRPWQETWTLKGCGHVYSVPLSFLASSAGTQIVQASTSVTEH